MPSSSTSMSHPPPVPPVVLHESARTRIFRLYPGAVCKEPLGRGAGERLQHEKQVLARLGGIPGIARVLDDDCTPTALALVDAGTPLHQLAAGERLPLPDVLSVALQVARSLAHVHAAGLIHCDVSPTNVLWDAEGNATLVDFDLAVTATDLRPGFTHQNGLAGKLAYMAPEQTGRTGRVLDHRADLYALGVMLFELVTGTLPFDSGDALKLMHGHLAHVPRPPVELAPATPPALSALILRLLEKEPGKRYQSARGLAADLGRLHEAVSRGGACDFALGQDDFGARLAPSQPIGRSAEIAALRAAVAPPGEPMESCVLVSGPAGAGKTTLVNELRPAVAARQGWLVSATFHEHRRDAFAAAAVMRALGRLLLAEPEEQLVAHRERIIAALGTNLGVGPTQLPEFEVLLGKHPSPPMSGPREAEARINQASLDLLRSVASPTRPVVMVLEDLQWAPSITLGFLDAIVTRAEPIAGLLVVGTFRAEDAAGDHPLHVLLERWRVTRVMPAQLEVANLGVGAMTELVADMLRQPRQQTRRLAEALHERTAGNPHDAIELMNALWQEGMLAHRDGQWAWNTAEVRAYVGECSVPSLLARRIARLPPEGLELLRSIACLGGGVRGIVLQAACGVSADVLQRRLQPAFEDGLLLAEHGGAPLLRFRHRRVQQVVLDGMSPQQRVSLHLAMARRLVGQPGMAPAAAEQYLPAAGEITNGAERQQVVDLFQQAASQADVLHYEVSERYLAAAAGLLRQGPPGGETRLRELELARHQILYEMGRLDEGDAVYASLGAHADDPLALKAAATQVHSLAARGRHQEALDLGLGLLAGLGITRPDDLRAAVVAGLERVAAWNRGDDKLADFHRPLATDPRLLATAVLLWNASSAGYFCDISTSAWLALEAQRMWAEHGPCPQLLPGLAQSAAMLAGVPQDHGAAYTAVHHAIAVGEARGFGAETSIARFSLSLGVAHWSDPIEEVLALWRRTREDLVRAGELRFAAYTYLTSDLLLDCAAQLKESGMEAEAGLAFAARSGHTDYAQRYLPRRQLVRALLGETAAPGSFTDASFDEQAYVAALRAPDTTSATYHMLRTISAAIFQDAEAWAHHSDAALPMLVRTTGYYLTADLRTLHAVSVAERARNAAADREALVSRVDAHLKWLRLRAADAPANFLHLLRWVEAERAWTVGTVWEAGAAFDAALKEATLHPRPWHAAIIAERAGLFHLRHGMAPSGRALLHQARDRYEAWGAVGKVREMERSHAYLRVRLPREGATPRGENNFAADSDALDVLAVLRASQSLSSETSVQQLRLRVADLLGAMTGATRVELALRQDDTGKWMLAGGAQAVPLDEAAATLLPLSAFRYAERTREVLLVDDAKQDDRFAEDPYVAALECCSLLLVPIASQGVLRAMLVLENRLSAAAFSSERLDAARLIAGQLAVSLENALLYQQLESRVQERTRELRAAQAQLLDTARRAGMAEIANSVLHNVGNVLNSVNVSANLVSSRLRNSKAAGLGRAVDLMKAHAADLGHFLAQNEKGRLIPDYLEKLAEALSAEQQQVIEELANLTRSVEHIKDVVATQQAHAGTSSVVEPTDLCALVSDALRMNSALLERHGLQVERQLEDLPPIELDATRVMQILVNLIRNGAQAMEGTEGERRLTLQVERVGDRVEVRVSDRGVGIPPENLARIFSHGFTTRKTGHGFGLHSSALAAREMGGTLSVSSEGVGRGATFVLKLPLVPVRAF